MVSIVVVSHSHALAQAAVELAQQMVSDHAAPRVLVAAGLDETTLGTDAAAIAQVLEECGQHESGQHCDGILVLVDLGSAVMSAEMALEFIDQDLAARVRVSPSPLVEGLVAAVVAAAGGADLAGVAAEAEQSLAGKAEQLTPHQQPTAAPLAPTPASTAPYPLADPPAGGEVQLRFRLRNQHGLHARPSANLVSALAGLDVDVRVARGDGEAVDGRSLAALGRLATRQGDVLRITLHGRELELAVTRLLELAADDFGEDPDQAGPLAIGAHHLRGPVVHLRPSADLTGYQPDPAPRRERRKLLAAVDAVDALLLEHTTPGEQGQVMGALRSMLHDPGLATRLRRDVLAGGTAPDCVQQVLDEHVESFEKLNNHYLRERTTDLRMLQRLLLTSLAGQELGIGEVPEHSLVVVDELDALTAAQLPNEIAGVVTLRPGRTGHGVVVAQARGIGVADGHQEAAELPEGAVASVRLTTAEPR